MTDSAHSSPEVEQALYELLASAILETVPHEKLDAFDKALSQGDDAFNEFLVEHVPELDTILSMLTKRLAIGTTQ